MTAVFLVTRSNMYHEGWRVLDEEQREMAVKGRRCWHDAVSSCPLLLKVRCEIDSQANDNSYHCDGLVGRSEAIQFPWNIKVKSSVLFHPRPFIKAIQLIFPYEVTSSHKHSL